MKRLYLIGGPMGVGKTRASQCLKRKLPDAVFLDGDWCWDADPFRVTAETRGMVEDNICHVLNNFLRCSAYRNVIFAWVMHEQTVIDGLLARLDTGGAGVVRVSLVCDAPTLTARLRRDIAAGLRAPDVLERSLAYLPRYAALDTVKVDTSRLGPEAVADIISQL